MDSVSQLALGAAVGVAVMGRRTAVWKAALWGGIAGTLPDLDVFFDHGDGVRNMTLHRATSHSLFWLTLAAPLLAALPAWLHRERDRWRRWWLAMWLALVTHPLLDTMTVYGTQLLNPFTEHPFGVGSIFIIDPLYTLPLLVGLVGALLLSRRGRRAGADAGVGVGMGASRGLRWNLAGLAVSTAYLAWSAAAQAHVERLARATPEGASAGPDAVLVTPSPFNTVLWRIVVMRGDGSFDEGFYSLLDGGRPIRFERHASDRALERELQDLWAVQRIAWFSRGFYKLHRRGDTAFISDLRMGQEPNYSFSFAVARRDGERWQELRPVNLGSRGDAEAGLRWLGRRLLGEDVPPPR